MMQGGKEWGEYRDTDVLGSTVRELWWPKEILFSLDLKFSNFFDKSTSLNTFLNGPQSSILLHSPLPFPIVEGQVGEGRHTYSIDKRIQIRSISIIIVASIYIEFTMGQV